MCRAVNLFWAWRFASTLSERSELTSMSKPVSKFDIRECMLPSVQKSVKALLSWGQITKVSRLYHRMQRESRSKS